MDTDFDAIANDRAHGVKNSDLAIDGMQTDFIFEQTGASVAHLLRRDFGHAGGQFGIAMAGVRVVGIGVAAEKRAFAHRIAQQIVERLPRLIRREIPQRISIAE